MLKNKSQKLLIRNSTTEFLVFTSQSQQDGIEVRVENENIWLTQKLIAKLFETERSVVTKHLRNIFLEKELNKDLVCAKFAHTANDGKMYKTKYYSLDAIISVGYRVNSKRATEFRKWATRILKDFTIKGYVLDSDRLKNGAYLSKKYFEDLLLEIRDIRSSERNFYQKITDIYSTAMDYEKESEITKKFFATVQNKLHFAIHKHTAAELIVKRANHKKEYMGLSTWKKSPDGKILKSDISIAKNYLSKEEIKALNRIVTMYLDYAEDQAEKGIPMTMKDWSSKLDVFLKFNEKNILKDSGKITMEIAKSFAESEFEKYRLIQDQLYESDFDKIVKEIQKR